MVQLGNVCVIERGGSPRPIDKYITDDENGINWIKIGDTSPHSMYITETKEKIKLEGVKKSRRVYNGDFLLSNSMSFGRPYILKIDGCIHDGWLLIRDEKNIFDKRFLYYYLGSDRTYEEFKGLAVGGVVNNLNSSMVRKLIIPLPPLETQQKIADVLDRAGALIEKRKAQIEKLDLLIKSQFIEMFGDPVTNPKGWELRDLGNCCAINPKKKEIERIPRETFISFVGMAEVSENGEIDTTHQTTIEEASSGFTYFAENDVLFAKITPCMENGKGAIARNLINDIGFGSTEFHVLRPLESISTSEWLYYLTWLDTFRKQAEKNMTGSAGQKRVPIKFIEKYKVPLPPLSLQTQFADFVNQVEAQKSLLQQSLEKLEINYKSLMQKCFRGEIF
jgi:Restriction endonuclease S subunits